MKRSVCAQHEAELIKRDVNQLSLFSFTARVPWGRSQFI